MVFTIKNFREQLLNAKHRAQLKKMPIEVILYHTYNNKYCVQIQGLEDSPYMVGRAHSMGAGKRLCEKEGIPFIVDTDTVIDEDDLES